MILRHDKPLRNFDEMISTAVLEELEASGVHVLKNNLVTSLASSNVIDGSTCYQTLTGATTLNRFDIEVGLRQPDNLLGATSLFVNSVIFAIGRVPNSSTLGLDQAGVKVDADGFILTDKFQNTSQPGIYSVGDVCGPLFLTPGKS